MQIKDFFLFFHRCCQLGSEVYPQGSIQSVHKVQECGVILEAAEIFILPIFLGKKSNENTLCTFPLCLMLYLMHSFQNCYDLCSCLYDSPTKSYACVISRSLKNV